MKRRCIAARGHDGGHVFAATDCIANPNDRGEQCEATHEDRPPAPSLRERLQALVERWRSLGEGVAEGEWEDGCMAARTECARELAAVLDETEGEP